MTCKAPCLSPRRLCIFSSCFLQPGHAGRTVRSQSSPPALHPTLLPGLLPVGPFLAILTVPPTPPAWPTALFHMTHAIVLHLECQPEHGFHLFCSILEPQVLE